MKGVKETVCERHLSSWEKIRQQAKRRASREAVRQADEHTHKQTCSRRAGRQRVIMMEGECGGGCRGEAEDT